MPRRRVALPRRVRFRCTWAALGVALSFRALPAGAADPTAVNAHRAAAAGGLLFAPPLAPQLSLSLDGRDWQTLAGATAPIPRLGPILDNPAVRARLRAGVEIAALIGLNAINFWAHPAERLTRAELSWSWEGWRSKVITMQGVALDANHFETNAVMHPFAGTLYYLAARGNGLGMGESLLFTLAGSAVWEYVVEFPEKVSLNDLVFTPMAGFTIGEPLDRLGHFFARGADTAANRALSTVLSPFAALHRWMDGRPEESAPRLDRHGLPADVRHHFDLFAGALALGPAGGVRPIGALLAARADLVDVPAGPAPGGSFVDVAIEAAIQDGDLVQFDYWSRVALGGYAWQSLTKGARGLTGYSLFAGTASAYSYAYTSAPARPDKVGAVHLLGPALDLWIHHFGLRLRARLDAYADFAAVRSAAVDGYVDGYGPQGIKSSLVSDRYYFAFGLTARPSLSASYRGIDVGGQVGVDLFESIDGADRIQRELTQDFHLKDRRLRARAWLGCTLPGDRIRISLLDVERRARDGTMGPLRAGSGETRLRFGASVMF